jgi:hypothetical protein
MNTQLEKNNLLCKKQECGKEFIVIPQEAQFYKQKNLPLPDHCPSCRHQQRMALRSERKMYKRTCDKCENKILSVYPKDAPYTIYCQDCFWKNIG